MTSYRGEGGSACRETNKQHSLPQEIEINQREMATAQGLAAIQCWSSHTNTQAGQFNCLSRWQTKTTTETAIARDRTSKRERIERDGESEKLIEVSIRK